MAIKYVQCQTSLHFRGRELTLDLYCEFPGGTSLSEAELKTQAKLAICELTEDFEDLAEVGGEGAASSASDAAPPGELAGYLAQTFNIFEG